MEARRSSVSWTPPCLMQLNFWDLGLPGRRERRQLPEFYTVRVIMEGIAAKITSLHLNNVWRQRSVCSVAYPTLLITGCTNAPSEAYELFKTPCSTRCSLRSLSVDSWVHYTDCSAMFSSPFFIHRMSRTESVQRTGHAIKGCNWQNAVTNL